MYRRVIWSILGIFLGICFFCAASTFAQISLEVLSPRCEIEPPKFYGLTPRIGNLTDKTIGIYWNGKMGGDNFFDAIESLLREKDVTVKVKRYRGAFDLGEKLAAIVAAECDAIIYGVGD